MDSLLAYKPNEKVRSFADLFELIGTNAFQHELKNSNLDWNTGKIDLKAENREIFYKHGYLEKRKNRDFLTRQGFLFISRISLDLEGAVKNASPILGKYSITKTVSIGKNSATFSAKHAVLENKFFLKFVRPGASENLIEALKILSSIKAPDNLIQPIDYFPLTLTDIFSRQLEVGCVVYPKIEGVTFREFLNGTTVPFAPHTVASFIQQVGDVLAHLEASDAYHGDLHQENILVNVNEVEVLKFNIIDVSFGLTGSLSADACKDNDLTYFKQHIWHLLTVQQHFLKKMSVKKYLGAELYNLILAINSTESDSFGAIMDLYKHNPLYERYKYNKEKFLKKKFIIPAQFKLQRYEEITDPEIALKLFVPFPELMENLKKFENIFITGNRGSGKSTYLAALAFFPKLESSNIDYKKVFGVYFPCRQGEFRLLANRDGPSDEKYDQVKHIFILKIVRRTLKALCEGVDNNKLTEPLNYSRLKESLERFTRKESLVALSGNIISEIRNLVSIFIRLEMRETDLLLGDDTAFHIVPRRTEIDLVTFFESVRSSFPELTNTEFHLLFDDAGTPNIPTNAQRVLNDLVQSSNPICCVKLTKEKYSYEMTTTHGKNLESGHDYSEYDLSSLLFFGAKTIGLTPDKLERYCRDIIKKRLSIFGFKSNNIEHYLGDFNRNTDKLVNFLAMSRRNAYYSGWPIVWKLADRTPRNLLELISEIFAAANINETTLPDVVDPRNQDRAIRGVSEKRLRAITQISGELKGPSKDISLGRALFEVTSALGSVFRVFLKDSKRKKRKDQFLAVERNDSNTLSTQANAVLQKLIKYGIFDESRLEFARDDRVKKPIYMLNRIYCPAFEIGITRDQHLRLSHKKFEQLLLEPTTFIRQGTKRLRAKNENQLSLRIEDLEWFKDDKY